MVKIIYKLIYGKPLYHIIIVMTLCVVIWAFAAICMEKWKINIWRWINRIAFVITAVVILDITLFSRSEGSNEVILIPLHSFAEARIQPEMYRTMLMNAFMFLPLGLTAPFSLPQKTRRKAVITVLSVCIFSTAIEFLQYQFSLGRCETDDVIMNTLGAAIGSCSYLLMEKFEKSIKGIRLKL